MKKIYLFATLIFAFFAGNEAKAQSITFGEVNYNNDSTITAAEWIELYNYGASSIDISGWKIHDPNLANAFTIPTGFNLAAGARLVLCNDTTIFKSKHPTVTNRLGNFLFGLSNSSDIITLEDALGNVKATMTYGDSIPWPKCADGLGRTLELKTAGSNLSDAASWFCGCMNGSPGVAFSPCATETLIVSEINYKSDSINADAGDWFEIWNKTNTARNLAGWRLRDDKMMDIYDFPTGTIVNPQSRLVVFADDAKFTTRHPNVINKVGPFTTFGLGSADAIRLYDNLDHLQFSVTWRYDGTWAPEPNGMGFTLELDTLFTPADDICASTSWFKSCPEGSPGTAYIKCGPAGIENANQLQASVFPIPTNTVLNVQLVSPAKNDGTFEIFDGQGKKVIITKMNKNSEFNSFSVTDLSPGVYVYRYHDTQGNYFSGKFVKN